MSLILDALRKSEAERRRGTSPDLFASLPTPVASRRPELLRLWPWFAIVALGLGAGAVLWISREAGAPTAAVPAQTEAAGDRLTDLAGQDPSSADPAGVPGPVTAPITAPAPPPAAVRPNAEAPAIAGHAVAMPPPPTPVPATLGVAAPPPAADALEPLPPITVLTSSERTSLPPLKLSMHVWNSEPGKRFAIIDGQRVGEGATVGNGVIEEIRRDGVVLEIDGRRILLPRP